jgi:glycerophosphoryl diester phosphodiesterase
MAQNSDWLKTLPVVIAHRGASFYAPENTLPAFELAFQQGAQAVELDVKLTLDGQIIVMHDASVDRTTEGQGRVSALRWAEIEQLDAGTWKSDRFKNTPVPLLKNLLETLADRLLFNIELTNYATPFDRLPGAVVQLVKHMGLEHRVLFSSFNPWTLLRVWRRAPEIPIGLLVHERQPRLSRWLLRWLVPHQAWHPSDELIRSSQIVERVHRTGRLVNVWTVNQPQRMQELLDWGVDGIMTDDPPLLLDVLRTYSTSVE